METMALKRTCDKVCLKTLSQEMLFEKGAFKHFLILRKKDLDIYTQQLQKYAQ